jgi:superfamily II DNA or RNA helicase
MKPLDEYQRFFRFADRTKDGRIHRGFRQKFSGKAKGKIQKKISKQEKALKSIGYGYPIFTIGPFSFTLGSTTQPAFDLESIPTELNPGRTMVYFNINAEKKHGEWPFDGKSLEDVKEWLGLKTRGLGRITLNYKRPRKGTAKSIASKKMAWALMTEGEKQRAVLKEAAKQKYPFSFPTRELIAFIDQIQTAHPALAIALIKVYFGTQPGSATDCPDVMTIAELGTKTKITDKASLKLLRRYIKPIEKFRTKKTPLVPDSGGKSLYPFQLTGIAFWRASGGRALIADQMGIGKTMQAVGALRLTAISKDMKTPFPALIVCPRSTMDQWWEAIVEWIPEIRKPLISTGKDLKKLLSKKLPPKTVVITTYASMRNEFIKMADQNFQFIVFDESQSVKNSKAFQTQVAIKLGHKARYVALLSGSPEEKGIEDLWAQFHIIAPQKFPTLSNFVKSMETIDYDPKTKRLGSMMPHNTSLYDGKKILMQRYTISSAGEYLVEPVGIGKTATGLFQPLYCHMIRRLKSQVLKQLPPKSRVMIKENLSPNARKKYEVIRASISERIRAKRLNRWAEETVKQLQIHLAEGKAFRTALSFAEKETEPLLEKLSNRNALQIFNELRRSMGYLKVPLITEWVAGFYQQNPEEALLIFAEQHEVINQLKANISKLKKKGGKPIRVATFTGKTTNPQRRKILADFRKGLLDVLIINKAGNTGLNLQRASYVLFAERYWNPSDEEQAEDRTHRDGKKEPVTVYYINIQPWKDAKGEWIETIDQKIQDTIDGKRSSIASHIGNQQYKTTSKKSKQLSAAMLDLVGKSFTKFNSRSKEAILKDALKKAGIRVPAKKRTSSKRRR